MHHPKGYRHYFDIKYLNDGIISLREVVLTVKNWLNPPRFNEVSVPRQESKQSCICMLGVCIYFIPVSTIVRLDFGVILMVWYIWFAYYVESLAVDWIRVFFFLFFFSLHEICHNHLISDSLLFCMYILQFSISYQNRVSEKNTFFIFTTLS